MPIEPRYSPVLLRSTMGQPRCCAGNRCCAVARLNGEAGPQCAFCSEVDRWLAIMDGLEGNHGR